MGDWKDDDAAAAPERKDTTLIRVKNGSGV